jgi:glycosyltransferase involved in cell wall biosynthesis
LISVILPVYNGQDFLRETILSVLNQTYSNFEFIIVDDGSTDDSRNIVNDFSDPRIVFFSRSNFGLSETLNFAINKSRFNLIARIDQDDIMHAERLEFQLNHMVKNEDIGLLATWAHKIDRNGKIIGSIRPSANKESLRFSLYFLNEIVHSSVMFRKKILLDFNLYSSSSLTPPEDFELWSRINLVNSNLIQIIEKYLTTIRIHSDSMSYKNFLIAKNSSRIVIRNLEAIKIDSKFNSSIVRIGEVIHRYKPNYDVKYILIDFRTFYIVWMKLFKVHSVRGLIIIIRFVTRLLYISLTRNRNAT